MIAATAKEVTAARIHSGYVLAMCAALFVFPALSYFHRELGAVRNWQYLFSTLLVVALIWTGQLRSEEPARLPGWLKWMLAVAVAGFCLWIQLGKYLSFRVNGVDFSIFDWMLYNSNHRAFGYSPIYDVNHFGVHANYVLLPLIPLHRVFESHLLLVLTTAVVVGGAAFPLWRLGQRSFQHEGLSALLVLAYLTNPFVAPLLDGGFRPEVLYPLVGFAFLLAWVEGRTAAWVAAAIGFLAIKEDAAFYVVAFCVGVVLFERSRWRPAVVVAALAIGVLVFNVGYLQPLLLRPYGARQPTYVSFWGQYGSSLPEILRNMAGSPLRLAGDLLTSGGWRLFGAALFLPLLSARALMPMLPTMFLLGSASYPAMHGYHMYYPVTLLPFFFWGLTEAWSVLGKAPPLRRWRSALMTFTLLVFPLVGAGYSKFRWPSFHERAALTEVIARVNTSDRPVCAQTVLFPHLPYAWDLSPLFDCSEAAGVRTLLNPRLDPSPHPRSWLDELIAQARAQGTLQEFSEGFVLIEPAHGAVRPD